MSLRRKIVRDAAWLDDAVTMDYPSGSFDANDVVYADVSFSDPAANNVLFDASDIIYSDASLYGPGVKHVVYGDLSSESLEYEDRKVRLQTIIEQMVVEAPSWDGEPATISNEAAETALRFLKALPSNRELPKVAPDGEGDVLFVWEPPHGNCIVTVQGGLLHMVDRPSTVNSEHIDGQRFAGYRIPISILHAIPMK